MQTGPAANQAAGSSTPRRLAALGLAGYGVVHLLVAELALQLAWGGLLAWAGITLDPDRATGFDSAVRAVARARWGPELLTAIAVGIGLFSVYCIARARHPVS